MEPNDIQMNGFNDIDFNKETFFSDITSRMNHLLLTSFRSGMLTFFVQYVVMFACRFCWSGFDAEIERNCWMICSFGLSVVLGYRTEQFEIAASTLHVIVEHYLPDLSRKAAKTISEPQAK